MSVRRKIVNGIARNKKIFVGLEDSKRTWVICVRADREIIHETSMPARYDARRLAKDLEDGNSKSCYVPDDERLDDRQIARDLNTVKKDIRREKLRIRSKLTFHGIETGITAETWNKGQYRYLRFHEYESAKLRDLIHLQLDKLEMLWAYEKKLLQMLNEVAKSERYAGAVRLAKSLPGIGLLTAIRLILELGEDFSRFKSGGEIASFVGLGGTEHSTGERERRGGITKQGNAQIRSWLIESAWIAKKRDPALQDFYQRIKGNSGSANKAITAVARKLITRVRSCIVNNVEYQIGVIE